jgi:tyrosyl-tRNA synthetase
MMVKSKLVPSKGEAKRAIMQGGVSVDDEKITAFDYAVTAEQIGNGLIIKKGKKSYHRFVLE